MPHFHIISLFPEFFTSPLAVSLMGRAIANGTVHVDFLSPRDFSGNRQHSIDAAPYGGGAGMVMQAAPVWRAIKAIERPGRIICLSPAGKPLTVALARELAQEEDITLVCGRYEGIDARLMEALPIEEISLCDAVLNGGETAALALMECVCRFAPGFLGAPASLRDESFANGLLEYPQYTRPEIWGSLQAPGILLSGHEAKIRQWRRRQALAKTLAARPELLRDAPLEREDAEWLAAQPRLCPGRNLSFCLAHYPVWLEKGRIGASSLTNLDVHDIARVAKSYGMAAFYVLTPLEQQLCLLRKILAHWLAAEHTDRAAALELVRPCASFEQMDADAAAMHGIKPAYVAASAQWPRDKNAPAPLAPAAIRAMLARRPVIICLGTARGLAPEFLRRCDGQMRPLRFLDDNHLSVRGAAAILADRILGDFC